MWKILKVSSLVLCLQLTSPMLTCRHRLCWMPCWNRVICSTFHVDTYTKWVLRWTIFCIKTRVHATFHWVYFGSPASPWCPSPFQGCQPPGKPGKVREFHVGQGKVKEFRNSPGIYGLPVVCYCSCDSHKINLTRVLLSKVDMQRCTANSTTVFTEKYM